MIEPTEVPHSGLRRTPTRPLLTLLVVLPAAVAYAVTRTAAPVPTAPTGTGPAVLDAASAGSPLSIAIALIVWGALLVLIAAALVGRSAEGVVQASASPWQPCAREHQHRS